MNANRIIFVGESRRKYFCQQIQNSVKTWLKNWSFDANQKVVVRNLAEYDIKPTSSCVFTGKDETAFWFEMELVGWESLLWKESLPKFPQDKTGKRIIDEAMHAFWLGLMRGLMKEDSGNVSYGEAKPIVDSERAVGDGVLAFDVQINSQRLVFAVEVGTWLDRYSRVGSNTGLTDIYKAVADKTVNLPINLDLGEFDIATISKLGRGDVLVSDVPLSSLFKLKLCPNRSLDVYLGKIDARRAIQLQ